MRTRTSLRTNGEKTAVTATTAYITPSLPSKVEISPRRKEYPSAALNCAAIPKRKASETKIERSSATRHQSGVVDGLSGRATHAWQEKFGFERVTRKARPVSTMSSGSQGATQEARSAPRSPMETRNQSSLHRRMPDLGGRIRIRPDSVTGHDNSV